MVAVPTIKTELIPIFPTVVGTTVRDDPIDDLCIISALSACWQSDITSPLTVSQTTNGVHHLPSFEQLNNHVTESVKSYLHQHAYNFEDSDLYIAAAWANRNYGNALPHPMHRHSNSLVSVVYYASAPHGSGDLVFDHPNPTVNSISPETTESNNYNSFRYRITAEQGKSVIFKSSTAHGTMPHTLKNDDARISIAYTFNLKNIGPTLYMGNYEPI